MEGGITTRKSFEASLLFGVSIQRTCYDVAMFAASELRRMLVRRCCERGVQTKFPLAFQKPHCRHFDPLQRYPSDPMPIIL